MNNQLSLHSTVSSLNSLNEAAGTGGAEDDKDDQSISLEYSSSLDESLRDDCSSVTPTTMDVADASFILRQKQQLILQQQQQQQQQQKKSHNNGQQQDENILQRQAQLCDLDASLRDGDSLMDDQLETTVNTVSTTIEMEEGEAEAEVDSINTNTEYMLPTNLAHPSTAVIASTVGATIALNNNLNLNLNLNNNNNNKGHKRTQSSVSCRSTASAAALKMLPGKSDSRFSWVFKLFKSSGIGEPSVYHALVVIFLEFFAWGLLTMPVIAVLNHTFPDHTFLMNGLVMGIKGILSFLSAPLIGALSDIWGRKFFLLITVFFTCAPIPLMTINTWWFFAMISISGVFAVTFSVVFAYVADVSTVEERSRAYGLVSATFAASLVISPALGAVIMDTYGDTLVVALATAIAVLDVFFILVAVPESLPEKVRPSATWGAPISWAQADPFAALRKVGTDYTILMQCVTVLLSYLPEAGQYSCIFVYLKLKMDFNSMEVAIFIAIVGVLSIGIQVTLGYLMRVFGAKRTIILGLTLEMVQLLWYGFGSKAWMMWAAGILAALGSITYPAISAFVSIHSNASRQGAVQGMVTGMRGLCNGLGPAMFGVIFYLFNVDLNDEQASIIVGGSARTSNHTAKVHGDQLAPGPPFVFGAFMVLLAVLVAIFMPETREEISLNRVSLEKKPGCFVRFRRLFSRRTIRD